MKTNCPILHDQEGFLLIINLKLCYILQAASRVNTQGDVFQGLATLEVPISDIISQVERDQRSKIKHTSGKNKKDTKSKVHESVNIHQVTKMYLIIALIAGIFFHKSCIGII